MVALRVGGREDGAVLGRAEVAAWEDVGGGEGRGGADAVKEEDLIVG